MKRIFIIMSILLCFMAFALPVQALTFQYNFEFSGGTAPQGPAPWLTATFNDVAPNTVQMTLSTSGLTGNEFVTEWDFNTTVAIGGYSSSPSNTINPVSIAYSSTDAFKADGDGYFDLQFNFATGPPTSRLTSGLTSVFTLSGTGLTAESFNALSAPGPGESPGPFLSAAHVQGIGINANFSGWVAPVTQITPTPEPATMLLLGFGLAGLAGIRRKFIG